MNTLRSSAISLLLIMAGCIRSLAPGDLDRIGPTSDASRAGNVYLLRGFIGIWSFGIDDTAHALNKVGIRSTVYQDDQWNQVARHIEETYATAPQHEPLVLIGHSFGGDDAINIARELNAYHIDVDLIICLDPVMPHEVPPNVKRCIDIYQSNGITDKIPIFRGVALKPETPEQDNIENIDIRKDRRDLREFNTDHFNIEKNPKIRREIINQVLATCPPRGQWASGSTSIAPTTQSTSIEP